MKEELEKLRGIIRKREHKISLIPEVTRHRKIIGNAQGKINTLIANCTHENHLYPIDHGWIA